MLLQFVLAFFALILLEGVVAQQIDSPTALVQCAPARLTFSGGVPPYSIDVIPGGEPGAVALESIPAAASPITWTVDIAAGTNITLRLRDSTGALAFSSPVVVQPSSDDSCIGENSASITTTADLDIISTLSPLVSTEVATPIESSSEIMTASDSITSVPPSGSSSPLLPPSTTVAAAAAESAVNRAATSNSVSSLTSLSLSLLAISLPFAIVGARA